MDIQNLIKTDLNLLVTLYVLFEEHSVSRAAERLYITQSAVSKALSRLRERFDDPLFTRVGHELVPTPFLEAKAPLLVSTLDDISRLLSPIRFDPQTVRAEISFACPEMIEVVIIPRLLAYLRFNAPGIKIKSHRYGDDVLERLADGVVDFAISMQYSHYPPEYNIAPFLSSAPAVIARKGHPLTGTFPSFTEMLKYPRITVKLPDQSLTQFYASIIANQRNSQDWPSFFDTENMLSALSIVGLTDYLLPLPDFVADALLPTNELQKFPLAEYEDLFKYVIVTHQRVTESPMHHWFGSVLGNLGQEIRAGAKRS